MQYDFGTIDPQVKDGTELASDLNQWRDAVHSQHSGVTRPPYAVPNTMWVDTSNAPVYSIYLYDGSSDIEMLRFDALTHTQIPLFAAGDVNGPLVSTAGFVPQWADSSGELLGEGLPVQAGTLDDTAGVILRLGAFGLGGAGAAYTADLNTLTRTGFYSYSSTTLNPPPMGGWGTILHQSLDGSGNDATQIAACITGGLLAMAFRVQINGVWSGWLQILDAVSNAYSATYAKQVPVTASTTLVATDTGKMVMNGAASVEVPANVFVAGDIVSIHNNTDAPMTIVQGAGMNLYLAGVATTLGNRTLAPRGVATVWFLAPAYSVVAGQGIS